MSPQSPQRASKAPSSGAVGAAPNPAPGARYGYGVSRFGLLIPERVSSEVVLQPALFPMPLAPEWMIGLMNARGNVAPVFDLCQLLEGARHPRPNTVLLLDQGPWMVGLVVDKLPHTVDPKPGTPDVDSIPSALRPYFSYAGQASGQEWWEFDHRACFAKLSAAEPF